MRPGWVDGRVVIQGALASLLLRGVDGLNLYRYVRNNPVNLVDSDGMSPDPPPDCPDCPKYTYSWNSGGTSVSTVQSTESSSVRVTIPNTGLYPIQLEDGTTILSSVSPENIPVVTADRINSSGSSWWDWVKTGAEIAIGFTPLGVVMDVIDLGRAIASGNGTDIALAVVGFIPGGDFIKGAGKIGKKLDDVVDAVDDIDDGFHRFEMGQGLSKVMEEAEDLEDLGVIKVPDFREMRHADNTEVKKVGEKIMEERKKGDPKKSIKPATENPKTGELEGGRLSKRQMKKNAGYLEGHLTMGNTKINIDNSIKFTKELPALKADEMIFKALDEHGVGHTEYWMLNKLASTIIKTAGKEAKSYPDVKGYLTIVSEAPYCFSCRDIIMKQWNQKFPNTILKFVDGVPHKKN